ncbi:hypothetical protein ACLMJK_001893 [Lecanora helva]
MDPMKDTVPSEQAPQIKNLVHRRDGDDTEFPPNKRLKLQAGFDSGVDDEGVGTTIRPETDLTMYDQERLVKGLSYVKRAGKRNVTPRTQVFLALHQEAYETVLKPETPQRQSRAVVQALDNVYFSDAFLFKQRSPDEQDRLSAYTRLRRLELLANYGDYVGQAFQKIRVDLKKAAKDGPTEIKEASTALGGPNLWTTIADELEDQDMTSMRNHVDVACEVLGFDSNHMRWLIHEWTARRKMLHNQSRAYITECRWTKLAAQLCRDLKELIKIASPEHAEDYEKVLVYLRDEYFDVDDRDDPECWFPNQNARNLSKQKIESEQKKQAKK